MHLIKGSHSICDHSVFLDVYHELNLIMNHTPLFIRNQQKQKNLLIKFLIYEMLI